MADKEYYRQYRKKNAERVRRREAKWREANRETLRKYQREYARKRRAKRVKDAMKYEEMEEK